MMTRSDLQSPPNDSTGDRCNTAATSRRATALAGAAEHWPFPGDLFADEFLADVPQKDSHELANLLKQLEEYSLTAVTDSEDLLKFRDLLLDVSQSVFIRWRVLNQLRTMALTDELTGLYNRRGFLLLGTHNVRLAVRTSDPLFLFFADVNGLKSINDRCGRVDGDALLVCCAEVLKMTFRESDIIARIGGDEFAVLACCDSNDSRDAILKRLQSSIDLMNRDVLASYRLSLSVGASRFDPANPKSLGELLAAADLEMMQQKLSRSFADHCSSLLHASDGNGSGRSEHQAAAVLNAASRSRR